MNQPVRHRPTDSYAGHGPRSGPTAPAPPRPAGPVSRSRPLAAGHVIDGSVGLLPGSDDLQIRDAADRERFQARVQAVADALR